MNKLIQKILIIWLFSLLIRLILCFFWADILFPDEQGFLYYDIIGYDLILKFTGYIPKFVGFSFLLAPLFYAFSNLGVGIVGAYFGIRIVMVIISSMGVFTIYYMMKNFTKNDDIIISSTIFYNFNCLVFYYSGFIVTENLYYPLAPLILGLIFKHINSTHAHRSILETEKSQNFKFKYLIIAGLMGITLSIRITFALIFIIGIIFLIIYHEGDKFSDKLSLSLLLKEFGVIILFGAISLTPILAFSVINHVNPMNVLLQTIFWNIGFFQPTFNLFWYIILYIITILIPVLIYLPFIIKEILKSKKDIINLYILIWILVQHALYFGHQYEIALMRWNVSTFIGYFLLFMKGFEKADQKYLFLDKNKYLKFFLIYSLTLAFAFKIAFLELFDPARLWILILGMIIISCAFVIFYFRSRKKS